MMNIKYASELFGIDEKIIRKSIDDGMIEKTKIGRRIYIPDDIKFIPIKKDIKSFLFQILCYKNNPNYAISREMCPNSEKLKFLMEYLYCKGYITEYTFADNIKLIFEKIMLTDKAINLIFGQNTIKNLRDLSNTNPSLIINNVNIGLNVG